jgi:N-acetylgalactosamine-6-sulfatase
MNVWDHIPHFPVDPPKAYVEKFKDITVNKQDFQNSPTMLEKFELVERAGGDLSEHMRKYLAELLSMNDCIARLLAKVDELGLRENTIVVFSSDQGAAPVRVAPEFGGAAGKNAKETKGAKAELRQNMLGFGGELRGGKHNMYEGGVRVPFIIRWPGHVEAGRVDEKSIISGIDWLPTLCHIAGVKLPDTDFDGEDMSDAWLGKTHERTKPLFWKTSNTRSEIAILDGTWKLITPGGGRRGSGDMELFDLATDAAERKNLAKEHPDIVAKLSAKIDAWNATLPKDYLKSQDKDQ